MLCRAVLRHALLCYAVQRGDLVIASRRRGAVASAILTRSQDLHERGELDASLRYKQHPTVCLTYRLQARYILATQAYTSHTTQLHANTHTQTPALRACMRGESLT